VAVQLVLADVVEVAQVGAGVAAALGRAHRVQARVAPQLGQAGAAVGGPAARDPRPRPHGGLHGTSHFVLGAGWEREGRTGRGVVNHGGHWNRAVQSIHYISVIVLDGLLYSHFKWGEIYFGL
jgi:hypothetical protein